MSAELYLYIRLVAATILLIFGVGLTFGVIPQRLRHTIFDSARRMMGVAIMILPIAVITNYSPQNSAFEDAWWNLTHIATVYTITLCVAISFGSLLGDNAKFKTSRLIRAILNCIFYPIPLAVAINYGDPTLINIATSVTSAILFAVIIYECVTFYLLYKNALKRVNNFYSDDIEVNISWLRNSALFMLSIAMVSGMEILIPNLAVNIKFFITSYRFFVFMYVFFSFMRFIASFANMDNISTPHNALKELEQEINSKYYDVDSEFTISPDVKKRISEELNHWIEDKRYTQRNITLLSLANEIEINRSYISNYINTEYRCSFKTWITTLRVNHAKSLLIENPELSISTIATNVGFASMNSFTHAFKNTEGSAPNRWRLRNIGGISN